MVPSLKTGEFGLNYKGIEDRTYLIGKYSPLVPT